MNIDFTDNRITNLPTPVNEKDAANKSYVDMVKPIIITYVGDGQAQRTIDFGRTYQFGILFCNDQATIIADVMNYNTDYFYGIFTPIYHTYGITPNATGITVSYVQNFNPVTGMSERLNANGRTYVIILFP